MNVADEFLEELSKIQNPKKYWNNIMFKRQYRIQPLRIMTDGSIVYVLETRIFPFWWVNFNANGNYIYGNNKKEIMDKLLDAKALQKKFNKEKEIHKNPL